MATATNLSETQAAQYGVHADGTPLNQAERRAERPSSGTFTLHITEEDWRGRDALKFAIDHNHIGDEYLRVDVHLPSNAETPYKAIGSWDKQRKRRKGKYNSQLDDEGNLWLSGGAARQFAREVEAELARGRIVSLICLVEHRHQEELVRFFVHGAKGANKSIVGVYTGTWRYPDAVARRS